jgi:hypothetical protein
MGNTQHTDECVLCNKPLPPEEAANRLCSSCVAALDNGPKDPPSGSITAKEYARKTGYCEEYVRRLCRKKKIVAFKLTEEGEWRIPASNGPQQPSPEGEALRGLAAVVSKFETNYPISDVADDIKKLPVHELVRRAFKKLPPPPEVFDSILGFIEQSQPPDEVLRSLGHHLGSR